MRILLTGGTGLIGQALCQHWQRQGHELWVWSRDPRKVQRLCSGARSVQRLEELSAAQPFDAVVNLAGAPIADRPWSAARRELLWRSRVELTRQLVDWMGQQPTAPRVLLSASAIGWYGDEGDTPLTDASPPGGKDFGSTLCMAWEQEAERASAHGVRVVRLRIAPVLAHKGGMLARLLPAFKLGLGGRLGTGQQWMPWIHLDDQVGLIDFLLQQDDCSGPVNACAPHLLRNTEFTAALAGALRRPAFIPVPACVLKLALGEMSNLLLCGQRVQPRRAMQLGYTHQFPYIDAALAQAAKRP